LVYGATSAAPVDEDHPVRPRSIYAAHKQCIEHYLQIYSQLDEISYTICRISNAYGPDPGRAGQGYKILNSFILRSLAGQPITLFGAGNQVRDFIYIHDLTDALIRCGVRPEARNQLFNIGSGKGCRLVDAASFIRDVTGGPPLIFEPWPEHFLAVESGDYVTDIGKSSRLLGVLPHFGIREGILDTVRAYQQEQGKPVVDEAILSRMTGYQVAFAN
jgi:UDP-glucose 4-epimerase